VSGRDLEDGERFGDVLLEPSRQGRCRLSVASGDIVKPAIGFGRIDDERGRLALADLNAVAYGISTEWVRDAVAGDALWRTPLYGHNAIVDGHPVATALAVPLDGVLYVAFVTTATAHRRRGLAELVMRRCLESATRETRITRTALHATADGCPSYARMGYQPVDEFSLFVPS